MEPVRPNQTLNKRPKAQQPLPQGLAARRAASLVIDAVLIQKRLLDEALGAAFSSTAARDLEPRDRAFARLVVATVIRRAGELRKVLSSFLEKPLASDATGLEAILLSASAQLLILETPPHAAISLAVEQCRLSQRTRRFDKLANAVLRRVAKEGPAKLAALDQVRENIPSWLLTRWEAHYGRETAHAIAAASLSEPALDVSVKSEPELWAGRLSGIVLDTGSIRILQAGRIEELPGYQDGAWWVQDVAARLPAQLFGDVKNKSIADLCAAPGGKTAELAAAGANVTSLDISEKRIFRIRENLARLKLSAELVVADATTWQPDVHFDGVLIDAPCSATGTVRRHPDILHTKTPDDVQRLAALQANLLSSAARLVKPGGLVVYCTCSLEPEEGEDQIAEYLSHNPALERLPVKPGEALIPQSWITAQGDLRTFPHYAAGTAPQATGMDGFFASRLIKRA